MNVSKKTAISISAKSQSDSRKESAQRQAIVLKAVTNAERERLRISAYKYLLP